MSDSSLRLTLLAGRAEMNANPRDTKDHPFGVWDRMTFKFEKPR
jgi:predicted methyltransferase